MKLSYTPQLHDSFMLSAPPMASNTQTSSSQAPGPLPSLDPGWSGRGCFLGTAFHVSHPTTQVRLERIRQAETLEQVRSILDEAPLRDIKDIKDS